MIIALHGMSDKFHAPREYFHYSKLELRANVSRARGPQLQNIAV